MWIVRWFLLIIILFFLVGFFSQNSDQIVSIRIFGWTSPDVPLAYMMFMAGIAGYLLCLVVALVNQVRLRSQIAALKRESRTLQTELDRLRSFALEDVEYTPQGDARS
jgi:uncharacterized integral membrane protein